MRKIFSLIAAVLFAGSMMATEVTITPSDFTPVETSDYSTTVSGVTVAVTASTVTADQMRILKGKKITISAESNISSIVFTCTAKGDKKYGPGSFGAGAPLGYTFEAEGFTGTWTGSATSVTFTATDNQVRATQIVVTLEGGEVPPTPVVEYYVVGSMNNWALDAAYKLAANPAQAGEYMKRFTFAANDELKVCKAIDGVLDAWYPEGTGNNWVINEAGQYDVYFRPEGNDAWANHYFYVAPYVIPQYEVAEAIFAGLAEGAEVKVRGVITKMEFKGANFAKYGSVNIYVADATYAEGELFEFYNCYSMNADTFRTSIPNYDPTDKTWAQFNEVADENGYAIHVGDTVIAFGKYKFYNSTHELNTGCYIVYAKVPGALYPTNIENAATEQKAVKFFENGQLFIEKNGVLYNAQGAVVR